MPQQIEAIFFDMGNTLRIRHDDEHLRRQALMQIKTLLHAEESLEELHQHLSERGKAYKRWAVETLIEAPEKEFWTRWMLPDRPPQEIEPLAELLTNLWRSSYGRQVLQPDAQLTLSELANRGYHLGLISNTISANATPNDLIEYGWAGYFEAVLLSSTFGRRKPDPEIFWEATRRIGVSPARSAHVGDQISRDVVGTKNAGFAMSILIETPGLPQIDYVKSMPAPDMVIQRLGQLLDIFEPRHSERGVNCVGCCVIDDVEHRPVREAGPVLRRWQGTGVRRF